MISLNDIRWNDFEGGYRIPYDASVPLKKLEKANDEDTLNLIFTELWNELHHQGDVGLASYFSIPHIIRIAKEKKLINWNIFGLIAIIEIERNKGNNPKVPEEFIDSYLKSLHDVQDLAKLAMEEEWDLSLAITTFSAIAASKGQIKLAEAIFKMDEDVINEFLENY